MTLDKSNTIELINGSTIEILPAGEVVRSKKHRVSSGLEEYIESLNAQLSPLLDTMDVPEYCKRINQRNVGWMMRNLSIRNATHPNFLPAWELVKELYRWSTRGLV